MSLAYEIIDDLWRLPRHFASKGYDAAIEYLKNILPFREIHLSKEDECNGWIIPPKWDVLQAQIKKEGKIIFDGTKNPLSVVSHSLEFEGEIDLIHLKEHLHYDHRYDDAIPYHFRYSYRPWERDWGFCVTKEFFDSLEHGNYEVILKTREGKPELKILDFKLQGGCDYEILFIAHLDHPGMANDDLSGCAVGCELMNRLSKTITKFSYRLILLQEIIGSQLYLNSINTRNMVGGVFLEMLGVDVPICIQSSYKGCSGIDLFLQKAVEDLNCHYETKDFRALAGNDEIVFESYGIPMPSLVRFPYPEYHCDKDNIDIIKQDRLNEAIELLLKMVEFAETDIYIEKKFDGVVCLSNPNYNLYIDPGQPAFGKTEVSGKRKLMEHVSLMPKSEFLSVVSNRFNIEINVVHEYLKKWAEHNLIKLI